MMSAERRTEIEAPFGYTFEAPNPTISSSSYPPPGPQLLDTNELGYLESFFEDPSNVDSNIATFSGDFAGDNANMFSNTNSEWTNQGLSNMSNTGMSLNQGAGGMSQSEQGRQLPASADVYAAAGILHGNTVRQQVPPSYNSYSVGFGPGGTEGSQMNGYSYNSMQEGQGGDYNFNTGSNNFYDDYDAQDSSNPYVTGLQTRLQGWNGGRPSGPLNFGSDDNFRNSTYTARATEAPDKDLVAAVNHNFGRDRDNAKSKGRGRQGGSAPSRKRARTRGTDDDMGTNNDDVENSSEGESAPKLRRKSKVKEGDEEDDDLEERVGKGKGSRKKKAGSAQPDAPGSSPGDRKQSASAAKDRRENLTEEQKRSNHIQSEQKRRNLIKKGFEDLNRMVPDLRSSGQSKSNMLLFAAAFMRDLRDKNEELRAQIDALDNG